MKAIVKAAAAPDSLELREMAEPDPGEDHLRVRVRAAAICGTDLHLFHWNSWAASNYAPPFLLGHELCGEVIDAPSGSGFQVGELVTAETHIACGHCYQCLRGDGHVCRELRLYSKGGYGAMAETALIPLASARRVPTSAGIEVGSILEPLGVAVHALEVSQIAGASVAVLGCGPVGLLGVVAAKALGAKALFAAEKVPYRRNLAAELGATALEGPGESISEALLRLTDGLGVDIVIEATGNQEVLAEGLRGLRRGGQMSLVGIPSGPISLDLAELVITRGISIHGIYGRHIDATWRLMESLLASSSQDISRVITHRFPLAEYEMAFQMASSGQCGKVLLIP